MKSPNLFILGAPKCGTTSLAAWLARHRDVYMSPRKEPHFFNFDHGHHNVKNECEYFSLFRGVRDETRIAEASVWYLASQEAVPAIERKCPGALYVVCLRNPVDMAVSLFYQMRFNGFEYEEQFERAWRLGAVRRSGKAVRCWRTEPRYGDYFSACRLGEQYSRLLKTVSADRIYPVLLEDLAKEPRDVLGRLVHFLGIGDDDRPLTRENAAKSRRFQSVNRCVRLVSGLRRRLFGVRDGIGALSWIDRVNSRPILMKKLAPNVRSLLIDAFQSEIEALSLCLNRNLDHWTAPESDARSNPA